MLSGPRSKLSRCDWSLSRPGRIARELSGFLRREGIPDVSGIVRTLEL
jgi:hypothetical protein